MSELKTKWLEQPMKYDGSQLRSLFAYLDYKIQGHSVIAWRGACDIPLTHMVDGEDKVAGETICGSDMVHLVFELFSKKLDYAVSFQRLITNIARETLIDLKPEIRLERDGDDLFFNDGKLSISIATVSPVSAMIHFAINISNEGTPVKTSSLEDLGVDHQEFVTRLLPRLQKEFSEIEQATQKVHWVR